MLAGSDGGGTGGCGGGGGCGRPGGCGIQTRGPCVTYSVNTWTGNVSDPMTLLVAYGALPSDVLLNAQLMRDSTGTPVGYTNPTAIGSDWFISYNAEL